MGIDVRSEDGGSCLSDVGVRKKLLVCQQVRSNIGHCRGTHDHLDSSTGRSSGPARCLTERDVASVVVLPDGTEFLAVSEFVLEQVALRADSSQEGFGAFSGARRHEVLDLGKDDAADEVLGEAPEGVILGLVQLLEDPEALTGRIQHKLDRTLLRGH